MLTPPMTIPETVLDLRGIRCSYDVIRAVLKFNLYTITQSRLPRELSSRDLDGSLNHLLK